MPTTYRRRKPTTTYKKKTTYTRKAAAPKKAYRKTYKPRTVTRRRTGYKKANSMIRRVEAIVDKKVFREQVAIYDQAFKLQPVGTSPTTCQIMQGVIPLGNFNDFYQMLTTVSPGTSANPLQGSRYIVNRSQQVTVIQNQSLTAAHVTIYKYVPRMDIADSAYVTDQFANQLEVDGTNALNFAPSDGNPGLNTFNDLAYTPYMNNPFTCFFKIVGKPISCTISGGASKTIKIAQSRPYTVNGATMALNSTVEQSYLAFRGKTVGIIIRLTGQPTNDATTVANLGYTKPVLDIVSRSTYYYTFVQNNQQQTHVITATGFGTVTTPELITQFGQVKIADATAG